MLLRVSLGVESAPYFLFTMSMLTNTDALSYASRISKVRLILLGWCASQSLAIVGRPCRYLSDD
jgi:hypothetical protein